MVKSAILMILLCGSLLTSWAQETDISENLLSAEETDIDTDDFEEFIDFSKYGEAIFGFPDNDTTGSLVSAYNHSSATQNPEELGTYLEGDLLIPMEYRIRGRNGILAQSYRWPGGVVPYVIHGQFSARELGNIQHAINEYHTKTCVKFRPHTTERDYISIGNGHTGCWSSVGRLGGKQEVNLQSPSCLMTYGTPIHELMHVLGFFHEQNRYERDSYVKIMTENIKPNMLVNFEKSSSKTSYSFGVNYDYGSVMHYSPKSFSANGKPTIVALKKTKDAQLMGQRAGFSKGDIYKINAMYGCH